MPPSVKSSPAPLLHCVYLPGFRWGLSEWTLIKNSKWCPACTSHSDTSYYYHYEAIIILYVQMSDIFLVEQLPRADPSAMSVHCSPCALLSAPSKEYTSMVQLLKRMLLPDTLTLMHPLYCHYLLKTKLIVSFHQFLFVRRIKSSSHSFSCHVSTLPHPTSLLNICVLQLQGCVVS